MFEGLFTSFACIAPFIDWCTCNSRRKISADWRVCNMHSRFNSNEQPNHIRSSAPRSRTFPLPLAFAQLEPTPDECQRANFISTSLLIYPEMVRWFTDDGRLYERELYFDLIFPVHRTNYYYSLGNKKSLLPVACRVRLPFAFWSENCYSLFCPGQIDYINDVTELSVRKMICGKICSFFRGLMVGLNEAITFYLFFNDEFAILLEIY